jgi:hypothetical protein
MPKKKRSLPGRIVTRLRKGSLVFSVGWPPISYTYPLGKDEKTPLAKRRRRKGTTMTPIQREALPMIRQKIDEAKKIGRNDSVLWWSVIEYAVKSPRKAERTLNEILDAF